MRPRLAGPLLAFASIACDEQPMVGEVLVIDAAVLADCEALPSPVRHTCLDRFRRLDGACVVRARDCAGQVAVSRTAGCVPVGAECVQRDEAGRCQVERGGPSERPRRDGPPAPVGPARCAPELMEEGVCRAPPEACPEAAFPVPSRGCVDLETWCDAPWPEGQHVEAEAPPGGDGSAGRPFASVAEALAAEAPGPLLLGAGEHRVPPLSAGLTLIGRCPAQTRVRSAGPGQITSVLVGRARVTLARVRLEDEAIALEVRGGHLELRDSEVWRSGVGLLVAGGGSATVTGSRFEGARPLGQLTGDALRVEPGGRLTVEASAVRGNAYFQLSANGGHVEVRDSVFADARGSAAVLTVEGGEMTFTDVVFARNIRPTVLVHGAGSEARLERAVVSDTRSPGRVIPQAEAALDALAGGGLEVVDALLADNAHVDVRVLGEGSWLDMQRSVSRGTRAVRVAGGYSGVGVAVFGGDVELSDVALLDHPSAGLLAQPDDERGTQPGRLRLSGIFAGNGRDDPESIGAIYVSGAAALDLHDAIVTESQPHALFLINVSSTRLRRLSVDAAAVRPPETWHITLSKTELIDSGELAIHSLRGAGLGLSNVTGELVGLRVEGGACPEMASKPALAALGGDLTLETATLLGGCLSTLVVAGGEVTCADCVLEAPRLEPSTSLGAGALVGSGGGLVLRGATVADTPGAGVYVIGAGARLSLVESSLVALGPDRDGFLGYGAAADGGARLTLTDVLVSEPQVAGLVSFDSTLVGTRVLVEGAREGRFVTPDQTPHFGAGDGVHALDSDVALDQVVVHRAQRIGLRLFNTSGTVERSAVFGSGVGLVNTGEPRAWIGEIELCGNGVDTDEGFAPSVDTEPAPLPTPRPWLEPDAGAP